jgi:methyl-accepting chemotaxis protein
MKNMKVSMKLIVSFAVVLALTAVIGGAGIYGLARLDAMSSEMYQFGLTSVNAMGHLREIYFMQESEIRNIFVSKDDPNAVQASIDAIMSSEAEADRYFAMYETTVMNEADEKTYFDTKAVWKNDFGAIKEALFAQVKEGDFDGAFQTYASGAAVVAPISGALQEVTEMCDMMTSAINDQTTSLYWTLTFVMIGAIMVALIIAVLIVFYVSGLISKPLGLLAGFMAKAGSTGDIVLRPEDKENIGKYALMKDEIGQVIASTASFVQYLAKVSEDLGHIANGDLTLDVALLSKDDTMGLSLKNLNDKLNTMFSEINAASAQVSTGSSQVADGAQTLASGSTQQAASIQELSGSISEVAEKTKHNAKMAEEAAQLAGAIKGNAEKGSHQMEEMM